jgi:hypothetical protein
MTSPSSILSRAADLIRDTAAAASPGVWSATDLTDDGHPGVWWVDCDHTDDEGRTMSTIADCDRGGGPDARWIALMSPAVAPMIEQLLRSAAATCDRAAREGWTAEEMREHADDDMRASFALARAVLGEKEDTA